MASRFMHIEDKTGNVMVKHRGAVGRVIPVKDTSGKVIRWDGYVGQSKVTTSRQKRNCAWNILTHLGIQEQHLSAGGAAASRGPTGGRHRY